MKEIRIVMLALFSCDMEIPVLWKFEPVALEM